MTEPHVFVRAATAMDAPAIAKVQAGAMLASLSAAVGGGLPNEVVDRIDAQAFARQWKITAVSPPHRVMVAVEDGEVVGFAALSPTSAQSRPENTAVEVDGGQSPEGGGNSGDGVSPAGGAHASGAAEDAGSHGAAYGGRNAQTHGGHSPAGDGSPVAENGRQSTMHARHCRVGDGRSPVGGTHSTVAGGGGQSLAGDARPHDATDYELTVKTDSGLSPIAADGGQSPMGGGTSCDGHSPVAEDGGRSTMDDGRSTLIRQSPTSGQLEQDDSTTLDQRGSPRLGQPASSSRLELTALEVAASHQRRGHGSRLLAAAVDASRQLEATSIQTWALEADDARIKFLASAGFGPAGLRRSLQVGQELVTEGCWFTHL